MNTKYRSLTDPWPHQIRCFERAVDCPRFGVFFQMAAGKSKTAVDIVASRNHKRVLVLSPHKVLTDGVWQTQMLTHGDFQSEVIFLPLIEGSAAGKAGIVKSMMRTTPKDTTLIVTVNYESAWRKPLNEALLSFDWDCVILDESHRIKAAGSSVSRFAGLFARKTRAKQRFCLTGTPMPHSPMDLYGQYRFMDPSIFGTRYEKFESRHVVMGGFGGFQVLGYRNLEDIRTVLRETSMYIRTADALAQAGVEMPGLRHVYYDTPMEPEARRVYKDLNKELAAILASGDALLINNSLTKILRLQQLTSGFIPDSTGKLHRISTTKQELFEQVLEGIPTLIGANGLASKQPVVVFTLFKTDQQVVAESVKRLGFTYSRLDGDHDELADWKAGKTDVLIAQVQSGSEGIDLQRACYFICYAKGYSYGQLQQMIFRGWRPGQQREVVFIHLRVRNSIDTIIDRSLEEKGETIEDVLTAYAKGDNNVD